MAITTQEKLASSMYGLTGYVHVGPYLPGTMEPGEMAHVQGLYAGIAFSTGVLVVPDIGTYRPMIRPRRRG